MENMSLVQVFEEEFEKVNPKKDPFADEDVEYYEEEEEFDEEEDWDEEE